MCDKLLGLAELQIINITNCCGRVLTSSEPFEGDDDSTLASSKWNLVFFYILNRLNV